MKRPAMCLLVWVALVGWAATGYAKKGGGKAAAPADNTAGDDSSAKGSNDSSAAADDSKAAAPADDSGSATGGKQGGAASESLDTDETQPGKVEEDVAAPKTQRPNSTLSWEDIRVVERKQFLKGGRLELEPWVGITVNDNLIRHYVFGADLNYYLTDVFWIGLEGQYFIKELTDEEELLGSGYNQAPSLNQYLYGGALNFGYVPVYGKFAFLNRSIISWEIWASAGIGVTFTKVIPRDPANNSLAFKNTDLTANVGLGSQFFLLDWLSINFAIRDYIMPDKFEPLPDNTTMYPTAAAAKAAGQSELVNNIVFSVGVGFYLPTKFQYKTPR
jgi:outer membrane beta-barrel protein